ncbi:MAG: transcription antitermination factor NusB [Oscillospiraceae bacterium]|nr:transcription antitermination factor NusB [Oscillospiraceae bacterium]
MTRHESRQEAFCLLFERIFTDATLEEVMENAVEGRDATLSAYAVELATTADSHQEELDAIIEPKLKKWKLNRISKVSLAALRLAVSELHYEENIPVSVVINEAVELTKRFSGEEDASFVNGVLANIAKDLENK